MCRIYSMTIDGMGREQIAAALSQEHTLTTINYWKSTCTELYKWNSSTITKSRIKSECS